MATVTNLSKGSKGEEVKKLQEALINAGYDVGKTGVDGSYGSKTQAAVIQYQKDNGLKVDGIAGKNTLGSLYGTSTNNTNAATPAAKTETPKATEKPKATETPKTNTGSGGDTKPTETPTIGTPPVTSPAGFTYGDFSYGDFSYGDFSYDKFAPSQTVTDALTLLNQQSAAKPGSYTPVWQDEADAYLSQYQNRDPFSYDFNSDALYQQYKDNYIQQGQMAMMDAMGQASAMTGGYGNSYAQTVGQQAYNQQLSQLNDIMPELYGMAYDRYNQEGQDLLTQYSLYMDRENQEYGKYQDKLNNWYKEVDRLTDNYNTLYNREYDEYNLGYDRAYDEYNAGYNKAYNEYLLGYNSAWDEYTTDRSEEFSKWQTQQNQEFTASQNDKANAETKKTNEYNKLANLISSTGYTPTSEELEAAGMTEGQAKALKKSYTTSQTTSTTTKTESSKYKDLEPGSAAYTSMEKAISKTSTLSELQALTKQYLALGYSPDVVAALTEGKAASFLEEEKKKEIDPTPVVTDDPWIWAGM